MATSSGPGRPKLPEGKRVTISVKVSESEAAPIDAARGERDRSAWGRDAMLGAASSGRRVRRVFPPEVMNAPVVMVLPDGVPTDATGRPCAHPKARVIKGLCGACGTRP